MEQDSLCISWNSLPWKKFHRKSFSLQRKIYEAKQNENRKGMKRLQKLLLRSKSLHYMAVKRITDYYSFKGIFLSEKTKWDLVNEIDLKIHKWKNLLFGVNRIVSFITLSSLKHEVAVYIWNFVIEPMDNCSFITTQYESYPWSPKTRVKDKKFSRRVYKRLSETSFLRAIYFGYLKFLLLIQRMYKCHIFRSLLSIISNFYLRRCTLNFRLDLHSLYVSMVISRTECSELLRFLDKVDLIQENLFPCVNKHSRYSMQTGLKFANILFLYKSSFRIAGSR